MGIFYLEFFSPAGGYFSNKFECIHPRKFHSRELFFCTVFEFVYLKIRVIFHSWHSLKHLIWILFLEYNFYFLLFLLLNLSGCFITLSLSLSLPTSLSLSLYIYIYIYILFIYMSLRKNKTGHIWIINLFPSCDVFLIKSRNTKKINRASSNLMDKINQNRHRKEEWEGDKRGVKSFLLI